MRFDRPISNQASQVFTGDCIFNIRYTGRVKPDTVYYRISIMRQQFVSGWRHHSFFFTSEPVFFFALAFCSGLGFASTDASVFGLTAFFAGFAGVVVSGFSGCFFCFFCFFFGFAGFFVCFYRGLLNSSDFGVSFSLLRIFLYRSLRCFGFCCGLFIFFLLVRRKPFCIDLFRFRLFYSGRADVQIP